MIETTEAIVLKSLKYGDTSKIVTLYTKKFGKVTVIAKGARGNKNKFGSALEPMSYIQTVFYKKESREVQLLSQADHISVYRSLQQSGNKLIIGLCIIELLHATIHDEEKNEELFNSTRDSLSFLNASVSNEINFAIWYMIRLISLNGFEIDFSRCSLCHKSLELFPDEHTEHTENDVRTSEFEHDDDLMRFDYQTGTIACSSCYINKPGYEIHARCVRFLSLISNTKIDWIYTLINANKDSLFIISQLFNYMKHHIHGMRNVHTLSMVQSILIETNDK